MKMKNVRNYDRGQTARLEHYIYLYLYLFIIFHFIYFNGVREVLSVLLCRFIIFQ